MPKLWRLTSDLIEFRRLGALPSGYPICDAPKLAKFSQQNSDNAPPRKFNFFLKNLDYF